MLNDHGVRRLAIAVLQQAVADLHGPIPEHRRSAAAFIARREDFDEYWCAVIGLDGDAVRERLREQISQYRAAALSGPIFDNSSRTEQRPSQDGLWDCCADESRL